MKRMIFIIGLGISIVGAASSNDEEQRLQAQLQKARAEAVRAQALAKRAELQAGENKRKALEAKKAGDEQLKKAKKEIAKLKKLLADEKARAKKLADEVKMLKDLQLQGEYEGKFGDSKFGAQVVAMGNGGFVVYYLGGGLPGDGWDQKKRIKISAARNENETNAVFGSTGYSGNISYGQLTGKTGDGVAYSLRKVHRQSPTANAKPPKGAVVLFDGTNTDHWQNGKLIEGKYLNCGTRSKKPFGLGAYHIEFRTPFRPTRRGQGRGNSGAYIMGREIQILDSFGLEGKRNECGAYYGRAKPRINMCYPPLSWQTFDVVLKADDKRQVVSTVRHNGMLIHDNFPIGRNSNQPATINLQNHGNPVWFRNIWYLPNEK